MRRLLTIITLALLSALTVAGIAAAHSGLGAASPAPGSIVGGEITEFQLRYNSTVADVIGTVTDPNGDLIESEWIQDGNLRITVELSEPLSVPGEHAVRHTTTDVEDGDRVEAAYLFTYDPAASPPQLEIIPDDGGFPWIWGIIGVGVVLIGLLGFRLVSSMRQARNPDSASPDAAPGAPS